MFDILSLSVFKESDGQRRKKVSNGLQNEPRPIYTLVIFEGLTLKEALAAIVTGLGPKNRMTFLFQILLRSS